MKKITIFALFLAFTHLSFASDFSNGFHFPDNHVSKIDDFKNLKSLTNKKPLLVKNKQDVDYIWIMMDGDPCLHLCTIATGYYFAEWGGVSYGTYITVLGWPGYIGNTTVCPSERDNYFC